MPVGVVDNLVADYYQDIAIIRQHHADIAMQVDAAFDERMASKSSETAELTSNRQRLQDKSVKLLAPRCADAIDLDSRERR